MSESKVFRRIEQLRKEIEEHNHKYYVQANPSVWFKRHWLWVVSLLLVPVAIIFGLRRRHA